jgi:hypothetical protein
MCKCVSRLLRSNHPVDSSASGKKKPAPSLGGCLSARASIMHVLFVSPSSVGMTAPVLRALDGACQLCAVARAELPRRQSSSGGSLESR